MTDIANHQLPQPNLTRPAVAWNVVAQTAHAITLEARRDRRTRKLTDTGRWLLQALAAVGVDLTPPTPKPALTRDHLSDREYEVLCGISEGKSNADIGRELYVSEDTIKTHARRIYRKLGARDRAHAVALAFRRGIVS